jgi:hypothetical protein
MLSYLWKSQGVTLAIQVKKFKVNCALPFIFLHINLKQESILSFVLLKVYFGLSIFRLKIVLLPTETLKRQVLKEDSQKEKCGVF